MQCVRPFSFSPVKKERPLLPRRRPAAAEATAAAAEAAPAPPLGPPPSRADFLAANNFLVPFWLAAQLRRCRAGGGGEPRAAAEALLARAAAALRHGLGAVRAPGAPTAGPGAGPGAAAGAAPGPGPRASGAAPPPLAPALPGRSCARRAAAAGQVTAGLEQARGPPAPAAAAAPPPGGTSWRQFAPLKRQKPQRDGRPAATAGAGGAGASGYSSCASACASACASGCSGGASGRSGGASGCAASVFPIPPPSRRHFSPAATGDTHVRRDEAAGSSVPDARAPPWQRQRARECELLPLCLLVAHLPLRARAQFNEALNPRLPRGRQGRSRDRRRAAAGAPPLGPGGLSRLPRAEGQAAAAAPAAAVQPALDKSVGQLVLQSLECVDDAFQALEEGLLDLLDPFPPPAPSRTGADNALWRCPQSATTLHARDADEGGGAREPSPRDLEALFACKMRQWLANLMSPAPPATQATDRADPAHSPSSAATSSSTPASLASSTASSVVPSAASSALSSSAATARGGSAGGGAGRLPAIFQWMTLRKTPSTSSVSSAASERSSSAASLSRCSTIATDCVGGGALPTLALHQVVFAPDAPKSPRRRTEGTPPRPPPPPPPAAAAGGDSNGSRNGIEAQSPRCRLACCYTERATFGSREPPPEAQRPLRPRRNAASAAAAANAGAFDSVRKPSVSVRSYFARISAGISAGAGPLIQCMLLVDKIVTATDGTLGLTRFNAHRFLLTALVEACKTVEDSIYSTAYYAEIGGVSRPELIAHERSLLATLDFRLISPREDQLRLIASFWAMQAVSQHCFGKTSDPLILCAPFAVTCQTCALLKLKYIWIFSFLLASFLRQSAD